MLTVYYRGHLRCLPTREEKTHNRQMTLTLPLPPSPFSVNRSDITTMTEATILRLKGQGHNEEAYSSLMVRDNIGYAAETCL